MSLENDLAKQLHHIVALLSRESDVILQNQLGIGLSQYKILTTLQKYSDIQQKRIAKELGQTEASVSRQVKLLQQRGMLLSFKNPHNQREHLTGLTMKGARVIATAEKLLAQYHRAFFERLTENQQRTLLTLINKL